MLYICKYICTCTVFFIIGSMNITTKAEKLIITNQLNYCLSEDCTLQCTIDSEASSNKANACNHYCHINRRRHKVLSST